MGDDDWLTSVSQSVSSVASFFFRACLSFHVYLTAFLVCPAVRVFSIWFCLSALVAAL